MKDISSYIGLSLLLAISAYMCASCSLCYQNVSVHGNASIGLDEDKKSDNLTRSNTMVRLSNMPWHSFENETESSK